MRPASGWSWPAPCTPLLNSFNKEKMSSTDYLHLPLMQLVTKLAGSMGRVEQPTSLHRPHHPSTLPHTHAGIAAGVSGRALGGSSSSLHPLPSTQQPTGSLKLGSLDVGRGTPLVCVLCVCKCVCMCVCYGGCTMSAQCLGAGRSSVCVRLSKGKESRMPCVLISE